MTKGETRAVAWTGVVAAAVVLAGVVVRATGGELGTFSAPFIMVFKPRADALPALLAVGVLAAIVVIGPRLLTRPRSGRGFAATVAGIALAGGLTVNAMRAGSLGWSFMFDLGPHGAHIARYEILASLPALSYGPGFLLDRFAELVSSQPPSFAGHPPGIPLLLSWLDIRTAGALAALCIGAMTLVAPATYALGRSLELGERPARTAALLAACSPALVLFGVSSTDAVFALAGTVCAALLVARRPALRFLGAALLGVATQLTWLLPAIAAWAAIVVWRRDGLRAAAALACACAAAVIAVMAILAAGWGYDPIGTVRATEHVYRNGVAGLRPYAFWAFGSPVAFGVMAGLPILAAVVIAVARRAPPALALAAILLSAAVLGFTKAEVERIWLPFVPLACVAAAGVVTQRALRPVLAALAAQTALVSLLFATLW